MIFPAGIEIEQWHLAGWKRKIIFELCKQQQKENKANKNETAERKEKRRKKLMAIGDV